ncbi:MAG: hypothetical protein K2M43_02945 [Mycoplasmoidaceae bacterium]|nr:hypothetical protein [Mycoplasmoidaceae bacterium]
MFAKSNIPGSVVYLSSGFIAQNYQLIKDKGYGIFGYQKGDSVNPYSVDNMIHGDYN